MEMGGGLYWRQLMCSINDEGNFKHTCEKKKQKRDINETKKRHSFTVCETFWG